MHRDMSYNYHFTNYEFEQALKIRCPRLDKAAFLKEDYFALLNEFVTFLKTEPNKELIEPFILKAIQNLDTSKYMIEEFKLLILKFNACSYFFIGLDTAKEYFNLKKDEMFFFTDH